MEEVNTSGNKEKNAKCDEEERGRSPFLRPAYFVHNREKALKEFIRKKNENMTKKGILKDNISCNYFQITPDIVTFTSYAPFKKYERVVTLKNIDANARNLKFELRENDVFKVKYISDVKKKVAPGMLFTFKVEFYPQSCENYEYDLEIQTEGKSFRLPIRCMNDEIILDVQDEIKMNETPIYMKSEKSITIKNIGKYENKFQISLTPPFYVNSSIHVLKEGEMIEVRILPLKWRQGDTNLLSLYAQNTYQHMGAYSFAQLQTKITFLPVQKRTYEDYMIINYENGIRTHTKIRGEGIVAEVLIKDKDLTADDVYINKPKEINIAIKNLSFFLLTYNITKYHVYECKYDDPSSDIKDVTFDEGDKIIQKTFIRDSELLDENIVENALYKNEESFQGDGGSGITSIDNSSDDINSVHSSGDDDSWGTSPTGDDLSDGEPPKERKLHDENNDTFDWEPSDRSLLSHYDEPKKGKRKKKLIIDISPKCKKLYSDTNTTITVALCPQFASFYKIVIFLFIRGYKKEEKIVVYFKSIAPEIVIKKGIHKIDNILINTCKRLSFELVNNTPFDVPMKVEKVEDNYNEFEVARRKFVLLKNSTHSLEMVYMPKANGASEKTFIIHQKYTNVKRKLQVVSTCNFPQVLLDVEEITFNQVSHSFEYKKTITIVNKSELTLHYGFNIPNELKDEVKIEKNYNKLDKFGEEKIVLSFCPKQIKAYMTFLELYLSELKTYKKSLPFRAICSKPKVLCEPVFLNIEPMIIDKMYSEQINLINKSEDTDVKYELFVDEEISNICDLHISHQDGVIRRNHVQSVNISITSKIIGYILIVVKVKISGCEDLLFFNIKAYCTCPTVKIIPSIIDFEKCNCLDVKEKVIEIKNESPINTFISLSNELPVFSFSKNNFYIEPHESVFVPVCAECLDTAAYTDTLRVNVHRKEDILVPLKAQGVGSPILVNQSGINFEVTHTSKKYIRELIISNRGTSERSVYFLFESEKKRKKKNENPEIFGVTPRNVSIKGGSEVVCIVSALNCKEEKCEDILYVHEDTIGKKKVCASFKKIKIEASFVHPEIEICNIADFVYDFNEQGGVEKDDDLEDYPTEECQNCVDERGGCRPNQRVIHSKNMNRLMHEVEMKNLRNANVKFSLSTKLPFSVEQEVIELRPMEKKKNRIFFDVDFMNNKISNTYQDHLIVHFVENGRRQKYELLGKTIYPNIVMNKSSVDFQYILKNLFAQETVEIKNVCNFKVYFQWFFEENNMYENFNQVFNIIPHRGFLLPYEKKQITLTYNSINENYYNVNVLCQIKNGPIYPLKLIGGYSDIKYSINKRELNYDIHYKSVGEDLLTIQNTGKIKLFVEIVYNVKFPSLLYTNVNNFFIEPQNSKDIIFYFIPGFPQNVTETILLKICNFEEIKVTLRSKDRSNVLLLTVHDVADGCVDKKNGELAEEVYPQECGPNGEIKNGGRKISEFDHIDSLIEKALLPDNENSHYENQRKGLIQRLKRRYSGVFLSLGRHIEEILALYHDRVGGASAQGAHTERNDERMGIIGDEDGLNESGEVHGANQMDNLSGGSSKKIDSSEGSKRKYNLIGILKSYCAKNSGLCGIFSDLLKCFILNQKDDKYILGSFSKLKKLANFEKLSCHGYVSNEYILRYLKRVILENNSELQRVCINMGNVTIKEKKEGVITLRNLSREKVKLNYHLTNPEMKDIITLSCEHKEVDKDNSIDLKIIIDNKCASEKLFSEQMFICMSDKNYYTVDIKFNYIIPDLHLYYRQIHFEKVEVKKCLCKTNRLINTKNVNVKFKVKNIIFYNKKLEYNHLKRKAQIFIIPSKGIIKSNSFLDIRIFFEPSDVYKNAKINIELFIYHSNLTKTMDVYLNSVRDHVQADPSDIIVKPLLLNSGNVHHKMKITNFNNYSKYLFIYNLDNYYKYFQSFLYDLLSIYSHIYIEKNDEVDFFYSNLMHYLVGVYRRQLDRIRNCDKGGNNLLNGDLNSYLTQSWHSSENQEGATHEEKGVKLDDENKIGERDPIHVKDQLVKDQPAKDQPVKDQKGSKPAESQCKEKKGKNKSKKRNEKEGQKENDKTDEITNKKEKLNDILADCIPPKKDGPDGTVGTVPNDQQRNIKILENKIAILEELIQKNERKYNYFEEYLKIIKMKKKVKQNFLLICPKYVNHRGIGRYVVNNTVLNFSPLRRTETGSNPECDNFLTIGEIVRWCNEINEKDNYPSSVKRNFIHYIIHESNINRNRHSTKKLRTSNRGMHESLANSTNAAYWGVSTISGHTHQNSLDYYVSEVLNVGEKKRDQEQADDEINTNDGIKINEDKDSHLILKGDTPHERVGIPNEDAHDAKETKGDNVKEYNFSNVGKNKLKKIPNLRSIKSKVDNKHAISMHRKKNNCRNDNGKNNDGGSFLPQKAFFNKYNLRHNLDYVKHFFHFALLNDEEFMTDVKSFLKLTMTERKKNKGENSSKKNSTFANLLEIILQKVLLSPLYVNGVVFFFKKNEYINSECFFTTFLRLTSDENNHIIYLNPVEGYEEFFNPSSGTDRRKDAESEGGKRSDAKESPTTDAQRLKYFYENMTKKYQEKIERKLKEKEQIEKIMETLNGHTDWGKAELVPRTEDGSDKKKGDTEVEGKMANLEGQTEEVGEYSSSVEQKDGDELLRCPKKGDPWVDTKEGDMLSEKGPGMKKDVQCRDANVYSAVERLYEKIVICKEKKILNEKIIGQLSTHCIERNAQVDEQIIKYNKKVSKINSYMKNNDYVEYVSFYKELKIVLRNLLRDHLKKGTDDDSSNLACHDVEDSLACNKQMGEATDNETAQIGKEKRCNMFVRRINIQLSENFVEKIYQEDEELKKVNSGVIDGAEIMGEQTEEEEIGKVAESSIKEVGTNKINDKFDSQHVQKESGGGKNRNAVREKMPNGDTAERCNQAEESVKTVVNRNEELVRYLKQKFVQVNFFYFFINEELCFRKRNVLKEFSKMVQEKYRDVRTSAYFFDIPNSKTYDAFNMQSFIQIKKNLEKCESNFYVTNEKEQAAVVAPKDVREEDNVEKEEEPGGELEKVDKLHDREKQQAQMENELQGGKSKKKKKDRKKDNTKEKEAKKDNEEKEKDKLEDAGDEYKSEKKEKSRKKKKKKRSAKEGEGEKEKKMEIDTEEKGETQQKGKVQEGDLLGDSPQKTEKDHKEGEKEHIKSKDQVEEKKKKGRKKEKEKKKDTKEKLDESKYKKGGEVPEHRNDLDNKGEKSEKKSEEGKEPPNKNATNDSDANKLYLYGGKELTEEAYFEELEKKKYEIKDEYDHIFYNIRNARAAGEAGESEKKKDHYVIEFLEVDQSYDKRDEIRYRNITHVMLQKNTSTEINVKINTCKIVNIKKRICLIDLLGNYFYLNLLVVIDKPRIYSNPYFIFSNSVVMCAPRSNCFVLCKRLYNFDRVLIGRNVHSFNHIIQGELKEECEEHLLNYLKIFTDINSPKFKGAKMRGKNITPILSNSSSNEKDKYKSNNSNKMMKNNEISKHLYKHMQVLNLFNTSPFDCFVEVSFDNVPCSNDKNYQANELNSADNFISHNDFYVYPKKFFILSKKWKKIIVLFLPKKVGPFFEKLHLSIYSVTGGAVDMNYQKGLTNGDKKKDSGPLCDSPFSNDIELDLANKQIDNYLYDIFSLCLTGEGIKCCLKMSESYLNFHKILLNSVQQKNVEIRNCSYCDLAWFVDPADLRSDSPICINPTKGNLLKNERKTLTVSIKTDSAMAIKKEIKINYVEKNFSKSDKMKNNVYFTSLTVEGEVCKSFIQVSTEIVKEDSEEKFAPLAEGATIGETILKHNRAAMKESPQKSKQLLPAHLGDVLEEDINFKYVKVNQIKACLIKVKNTGKFKIFYVAEINEDSFLNYLCVECLTDSINSNEMKIIKLKVRSGRKVKLQNVPLLIHFYDMENNHIQTYKYSISVSFDYNYVKVIPSILNYDSVEVKKEETRFFKIINDGHFDFKYEIKLLKSKIKNAEKDEVLRYNNLGCVQYDANADFKSPFSISPISGLVKSKGEETVTVQFNSSEERQYRFVYIVEVENLMSDTLHTDSKKKDHRVNRQPTDNHREVIKIFASSVKPTISCDVKNIFEEVLLLKKTENYANFLDNFLGKNSYYNSDDNTLYYRWCHVNECINERIKICNTSDVNAKVHIEIKELEFANYRNKSGKGKEKEREKKGDKGKENENEPKRSSVIPQQTHPIRFNMRVQNDNEIKSKWYLTELNEQRGGVTYGDASSSLSTTTEVTRYQHKYLDICFYSNQIGSKKFLVNIHLTNQQNVLCFSFYISVEFFLPSINLIVPQSLLNQRRQDNIYDLGDIHLNSVISFKVRLRNCFKYPVFVKVFFERDNLALDCWRGMEERKGQLKERVNLVNEPKEAQHKKGDAKNSNVSESTYEKGIPRNDTNHHTCVQEKKDIYNATNRSSFFTTIDNYVGLRTRNNTTYFDYKNVKDLLYKTREKQMHMFSWGYLYYIGHSNYMIRENEVESIKIKVDKNKLEEMIKRRNTQRRSLKGMEGEECNAVDYIPNELDATEQTTTPNEELNKKGLEEDSEKGKKSVIEKLKRQDPDKSKDPKNVRGNLTKNSTTLIAGQEKQLLGSIQISVLNNNYEFYNLKFLGNIVETNNYWNLELLKNSIRKVYNGKNVDIFKNHINFDLLPVGYNHSFRVPYVNDNNHDLFFQVEVEKKIKGVIDIRPLIGSIPANSSFPFSVQMDIRESITLVKKQISFKFSANPFNKKNPKGKDEDGVYNDSLYVSLTSEEIKFSCSKKKIIFKNVPFFNYSKSELVLENMSNVKVFVELNIVPLNGVDDITSVYAFRPFSEKRVALLVNRMDKNLLTDQVTGEKTEQLGNSSANCKQGGNIKNASEVNELVGEIKKNEDGHVVGNPNGVNMEDETGENKPIDEFYMTKYDLTLSDLGDNSRNGEGSGFNETHIGENDVIGKCSEIIGSGNVVTSKTQQQCRVVKKYITIKGKQKKRLELFCFHHMYRKTFDAVLHIRIKFSNEISVPIKMTFENYDHSNEFVLADWNHNGIVDNMDEKKKVPKKYKMVVLSRGVLKKINHKIYMLNISNESLQYFFEKISETGQNGGRSCILPNSGKHNGENNKSENHNDNNSECINYKGCVKENNFSLIRFLFNIFNSMDYNGRYNLYVNDKKEQSIDFELKVIEPLTFFNTSSIHVNNLILGKSYCFVFYLINFDLMDINFEFDQNSYNSFNSKKETIKIVPFRGTVKSCYRKNKYLYKEIRKLNKDDSTSVDDPNKKGTITDGNSSSGAISTLSNSDQSDSNGSGILSDIHNKGALIGERKSVKKRIKVNYVNHYENTKLHNDSDNWSCSLANSSDGSASSSNISYGKNKVERRAQNERTMLYGRYKKEYILPAHFPQWEYINTSCDSGSESDSEWNSQACVSLPEGNSGKDENSHSSKYFLLNYYLRNIWKNDSNKFIRDVKHVRGKGRCKKIKLFFKPHLEQFYNFNLLCRIGSKEELLQVNFKTQVSKININCYIENFDQEKVQLNLEDNTYSGKQKKYKSHLIHIYGHIDFKETLIGRKKLSKFVIENLGNFDLVYKYYLQKKDEEIDITCSGDCIPQNSTYSISVEYNPLKNQTYVNYLTINIMDYYLINLKITAVAIDFLINFSFYNYDFGNVILFPVLDDSGKMKGITNIDQCYEESFSSSDSSLSSLIHTFKNNERDKRVKEREEEKAKALAGEDAQNETGKHKKGKKKRHKRDKQDKKKESKTRKDNTQNEVDEEGDATEQAEKEKGEDKSKEDHKQEKRNKEKHTPGKEKHKDDKTEQEKDQSKTNDTNLSQSAKSGKSGKHKVANIVGAKIKEAKMQEDHADNEMDVLSEKESNNVVEAKLIISNNNDVDCYIEYELNEECLTIRNYRKKVHLKRKSKICLFIQFKPNEEKNYNYKIPFMINGDVGKMVYIHLTGSATHFKLPFSSNNSNEINFENVHVDKESISKFTLHNKNSEDIYFNVLNYGYLEKHYLSFVKFDNSVLHILKKKEKKTFEVKFLPEKYLNVEIPLYLSVSYRGKKIAYYLTSIKLRSICYKIVLKENLLTFNKAGQQDGQALCSTDTSGISQFEEVKEKLFKGTHGKDSIKGRKIQLHNRGDMNAQFQIVYPQKYEKFLQVYPKKGIIFSFNITSIYIFVDTDFVTKDLFLNDVSVDLLPKFNKINGKIFLNIFINTRNDMNKCRSGYVNNSKLITAGENVQSGQTASVEEAENEGGKDQGADNSEKGENTHCDDKNVNAICLKNETVVTFLTDIRKPISKTIEICNETESNFKMKYKFLSNEGNFFSLEKHEDVVKPNESGTFQIVYNPLFVQKRRKNSNNYHNTLCLKYLKYFPKIHHISKLVIYYPNEVVKNYTLLGYANSSNYEKKKCFNFKSKVLNSASIRIRNWLNENQTLFLSSLVCDKDLNISHSDCFFFYVSAAVGS